MDSTGVLVGAVIALVTGIVAGVGTGLIFGIAVVGTGVRAERRHASLNFRNGSRAAVVLGVVIALTFGIVSWHFIGFTNALRIGLTAGVVGGLTAGLVAMVAGGDGHRPARGTRWNIRKASLTGLTVGLVIGVLSGLGQGLGRALTTGLASGVAFWVAAAIVVGLEGIPGELTTAVSPTAVLTRDRRTTLVLAVVAVVAAGIVTGVTAGLKYGLLSRGGLGLGLAFGLGLGLAVGLEAGLVLGLTISGFGSAWPHWVMARAWLALRRRLPWRLMAFLARPTRWECFGNSARSTNSVTSNCSTASLGIPTQRKGLRSPVVRTSPMFRKQRPALPGQPTLNFWAPVAVHPERRLQVILQISAQILQRLTIGGGGPADASRYRSTTVDLVPCR